MKNTSTHDSECNKTCTIYEYLDIKYCSGKKRQISVSMCRWDIKYN